MMRVVYEDCRPKPMSIPAFAVEHDLALVIKRYDAKWTACFDGVEVRNGGILSSTFGSGSSPFDAIEDYRRQIEGEKIVHNAMKESRREIMVPELMRLAPNYVDEILAAAGG